MSDERQSIPVAAVRAAVQESGQLEAIEGPQYLSAQSPDWRPYFAPSADGIDHPDFARVVITRQGQKPRDVVISWAEYEAEIETEQEQAWAEGRRLKPMSIFGAEVERHAYRVTFADVLADAFPPVEVVVQRIGQADPLVLPGRGEKPDPRDWLAEVRAANAATLNGLYDEAREAGALAKVEGLQAAIMDRMLTLGNAPKPQPTGPRPQGQGQRRRRGKPKP